MTNPDQTFLHRFAAESAAQARPIDSSPMLRALRAEVVRVDRTVGFVELCFEPEDTFVQGGGVIQGGAVAAMLDFGMAFAALALNEPGQSAGTVSMSISYLRAVRHGRLKVMGEVERAGRSMVFARAVLTQPDGTPLASALSTLLRGETPPAARHGS